MTGPAIKPMGPKNPSPPKMESKITNECIFIPFFIKIGERKLSDNPIRTTPHIAKPTAAGYETAAERYKTAGAMTTPEPTIGTKEAKADTTPQRIGLGTPKIANPRAVKNHFTRAIISDPRTIEFIANPTLFIICSS